MFYANTQWIFGVLRINRLTQHAFEAALARGMLLISDVCRVLKRETLFLPNKLKLTLHRCRETTRVRNFLLFIWKLNHFCQSWSEHACHFKRENVSPVHVCWFIWKNVPVTVIHVHKITVSIGEFWEHAKSMLKMSGMFFIPSGVW